MPFDSSLFVFVFAPLVVLLGACLPVRLATAFLLLVSIVFYAWGEPKFVFVVLVSALLDYDGAQREAFCLSDQPKQGRGASGISAALVRGG